MADPATLTLAADTPDGIAAVNRLAKAVERLNANMAKPRPARLPWGVGMVRRLDSALHETSEAAR